MTQEFLSASRGNICILCFKSRGKAVLLCFLLPLCLSLHFRLSQWQKIHFQLWWPLPICNPDPPMSLQPANIVKDAGLCQMLISGVRKRLIFWILSVLKPEGICAVPAWGSLEIARLINFCLSLQPTSFFLPHWSCINSHCLLVVSVSFKIHRKCMESAAFWSFGSVTSP